MRMIYVDRLSVASLPTIVRSASQGDRLFCFDKAPGVEILVAILRHLGLIRQKVEHVDFSLSAMRDEQGQSYFIKLTEDLLELSKKIRVDWLEKNSLIAEFSRHFDPAKLLLYFERTVADEIEPIVAAINIVAWHGRRLSGGDGSDIVWLASRSLWSDRLFEYATRLGLRPAGYRTLTKSNYSRYLPLVTGRVFVAVKQAVGCLKRKDSRRLGTQASLEPQAESTDGLSATRDTIVGDTVKIPVAAIKDPKIATIYASRTATFQLTRRSGFFWLLRAEIPRERVLVYFTRPDIPVTPSLAADIRGGGVEAVALSPKATRSPAVPVWRPGRIYKAAKGRLVTDLIRAYLGGVVKRRRVPLFYPAHIYSFILSYAKWLDFFAINNVKVNVNNHDCDRYIIPLHAALEKLGGVHISYQLSNLTFPSVSLSTSTDTFFAFGPAYRPIWEANDSNIDQLVYSGYVTDYAFSNTLETSAELKRKLTAAGARFIITYFDENSSDDSMSLVSNQTAAGIYGAFIEMLLGDETLGLIFKPKRPDTLHRRLAAIADVIAKAQSTGRCVFMDDEADLFPCTASRAADLSVGLLIGGTTALESYLAGTPAVFLDLERLYASPVYRWGKGKAVFDTVDELITAIKRWRGAPEGFKEFGDLSRWVKDRDPFRDGDASLRIGRYIQWLLEELDQGSTREEAISFAGSRYAEIWGRDNVVSMKAGPRPQADEAVIALLQDR